MTILWQFKIFFENQIRRNIILVKKFTTVKTAASIVGEPKEKAGIPGRVLNPSGDRCGYIEFLSYKFNSYAFLNCVRRRRYYHDPAHSRCSYIQNSIYQCVLPGYFHFNLPGRHCLRLQLFQYFP